MCTNASLSSRPSLDIARVNRAPIAVICCERDRRGALVSDEAVIAVLSSVFILVGLNNEQVDRRVRINEANVRNRA